MHPRAKLRAAMNQLAHLAEWYMAVLPEALTYVSPVVETEVQMSVVEPPRDAAIRAESARSRELLLLQPPLPDANADADSDADADADAGSPTPQRMESPLPSPSPRTQTSSPSRERSHLQVNRRRSRRITRKRCSPSVPSGPRYFLIQRHLQAMQERRERVKQRTFASMQPRRAFSALPCLDAKDGDFGEEEDELYALVDRIRDFARCAEHISCPPFTVEPSVTQFVQAYSSTIFAADAPLPAEQTEMQMLETPSDHSPAAVRPPSVSSQSTEPEDETPLPPFPVSPTPSQDEVPIPRLQLRRRPTKTPVKIENEQPLNGDSKHPCAAGTADLQCSSTQTPFSREETQFRLHVNQENINSLGSPGACQWVAVSSEPVNDGSGEETRTTGLESAMKMVGAVLVFSPADSGETNSVNLTSAAAQVLLGQDNSRLIPGMLFRQSDVPVNTPCDITEPNFLSGNCTSADGVCVNYVSQTVASSVTVSSDCRDTISTEAVPVHAFADKEDLKQVGFDGAITANSDTTTCRPKIPVSCEITLHVTAKEDGESSQVKRHLLSGMKHTRFVCASPHRRIRFLKSRLTSLRMRRSRLAGASSNILLDAESLIGQSTIFEPPPFPSQRNAVTVEAVPSPPTEQTYSSHNSVSAVADVLDRESHDLKAENRQSRAISSTLEVLTAKALTTPDVYQSIPPSTHQSQPQKDNNTCCEDTTPPVRRLKRPSPSRDMPPHTYIRGKSPCLQPQSRIPSIFVPPPDSQEEIVASHAALTPASFKTGFSHSSRSSRQTQRNRSPPPSMPSSVNQRENARKTSPFQNAPISSTACAKGISQIAGDPIIRCKQARLRQCEESQGSKIHETFANAKKIPETLTKKRVSQKRPVAESTNRTKNVGATANTAPLILRPPKVHNDSKLQGQTKTTTSTALRHGVARNEKSYGLRGSLPASHNGTKKEAVNVAVPSTPGVETSLKTVSTTSTGTASAAPCSSVESHVSDTPKSSAISVSATPSLYVPATKAIVSTSKTTSTLSRTLLTALASLEKDKEAKACADSILSGNSEEFEQQDDSSEAELCVPTRPLSSRIEGDYGALVSCLRTHERHMRSVAYRRGNGYMLPSERTHAEEGKALTYVDYLDALRYHVELVRLVSKMNCMIDDDLALSQSEERLESSENSLLLMCAEAYLSGMNSQRVVEENV